MELRFAVLGSGSKGNTSLVRLGGFGVLIDLGLGPRTLCDRMLGLGLRDDHLCAAVLTHTHGDHVNPATLTWLACRRLPLHCHESHRPLLEHHEGFRRLDAAGLIKHYDTDPCHIGPGLWLEAFALKHDGPTYGFRFEARPHRRHSTLSLGYLTDTGCWTPSMVEPLTDVNLLALESNHDVAMQLESGRFRGLIYRNLGDRGHLSNEQAAALISAVLDQSRPGALRDVVLLHLSSECNHPQLALDTARAATQPRPWSIDVRAICEDAYGTDMLVRAGRPPVRSFPVAAPVRSTARDKVASPMLLPF